MHITTKSLSNILLLAILLLCSCNDVYHEFKSVENCCWKQDSTLRYTCNTQYSWKGVYLAEVELRCTPEYPYKDLWIEVFGENTQHERIFTDTLYCEIYDDHGRMNGATTGMLYQMRFPVDSAISLPSDTVNIIMRHLMDDEQLAGVCDVGFRLSYSYRHQSSEN